MNDQPRYRRYWIVSFRVSLGRETRKGEMVEVIPRKGFEGEDVGLYSREIRCQEPALFSVLVRDEHVLARELLEKGCRLAEVGGQRVERVPSDPLRQVDRLVDACVET